jgi:hypothetical protein
MELQLMNLNICEAARKSRVRTRTFPGIWSDLDVFFATCWLMGLSIALPFRKSADSFRTLGVCLSRAVLAEIFSGGTQITSTYSNWNVNTYFFIPERSLAHQCQISFEQCDFVFPVVNIAWGYARPWVCNLPDETSCVFNDMASIATLIPMVCLQTASHSFLMMT